MLLGMNWSSYPYFDDLFSNPTGSKSGGTNTGMSVRRIYDGGAIKAWTAGKSADDHTNGYASMWSNSDTSLIAQIANGSQQAALRNMFSTVPPQHRAYIIWMHEWDLHVATTVTVWLQAWDNIRQALEDSTADMRYVKTGPLFTSGGWKGAGLAGGAGAWVSDAMTFFGIDFYQYYSGDPLNPHFGLYSLTNMNMANLVGACFDLATQHGKPVIVGENGVRADRGRDNTTAPEARVPRWRTELDYLDASGICEAYCGFSAGVGARAPWWWDSFDISGRNCNITAAGHMSDPNNICQNGDVVTLGTPTSGGALNAPNSGVTGTVSNRTASGFDIGKAVTAVSNNTQDYRAVNAHHAPDNTTITEWRNQLAAHDRYVYPSTPFGT
jgi:hypothetical protein